MATCILPLLISGSRKADGSVNAGGKIYLTQPGSANTRVTGYRDKDKLSAHTLSGGGYLLDAAGKIGVFVDQPCTVHVEDQDGVTVDSFSTEPTVAAGLVEVVSDGWTGVDPDTGQYAAGERTYLSRVLSSLASSLGGLDGMFRTSTSGTSRAVYSTINDFGYSVKSFGAKGDGSTDDTAAIQAAINYVVSIGGGRVRCPLGTYIVSSAMAITATGVDIIGEGKIGTIIKSNNGAANVFTVSGSGTNEFRGLQLTHTATSTGSGIGTSGTTTVNLHNVTIAAKFNRGYQSSGGTIYNSTVAGNTADATSIGADTGGVVYVYASAVSGSATGLNITGASSVKVAMSSLTASAATGVGFALAGASDAAVVSSTLTGGASGHGATIGASATAVWIGPGATSSPDILDSRPGAPIQYSFATNQAVTPLPLQTDTVRVIATAAITVTINAAAVGVHGQPLTIMCLNNSGGAVTWTFNAQYKTSGAVAPATGNGISVTFKYDTISTAYREVSRSASVAI